MDQGYWSPSFKGAQNRNWNAVIAAKDNGERAGGENFSHRFFRPAGVAFHIVDIRADIATVDRPDIAAIVERTVNIEIVTLKTPYHPIARLPQRGRPVALIIGHVLERIGRTIGDAEESDICLQIIEVGHQFGKQKTAMPVLWRCRKRVVHGVSQASTATNRLVGLSARLDARALRPDHLTHADGGPAAALRAACSFSMK